MEADPGVFGLDRVSGLKNLTAAGHSKHRKELRFQDRETIDVVKSSDQVNSRLYGAKSTQEYRLSVCRFLHRIKNRSFTQDQNLHVPKTLRSS